MKNAAAEHILVSGRRVDYRVVRSRSARKLRIRVGVAGVQVVVPAPREPAAGRRFLEANSRWVVDQVDRIEQLRSMRRPRRRETSILYRGEVTPVRVEARASQKGPSRVVISNGAIIILQGDNSSVLPARSLENWLRRRAKQEIANELADVISRLRRKPNKIFVMGQRTKWGNCSAMRNLSFNWRLIMAPPFVFRYLVTHEAAHLAVPDHSRRFWLTVQSLCPQTERAKQWLVANADRLMVDLREVIPAALNSSLRV
jgi:predicted metal-dependent hydrolase